MKQYQFAGIIPARYASSRFPGKPLAVIGDKTMVRRVFEQASKSLDFIFVATDDRRIHDEVIGKAIDIVVNIQGDEPFLIPEQIDLVKSCFNDQEVEIATLVRKISPGEDIFNPNNPKVILDHKKNAIYFSRSPLPFIRDLDKSEWSAKHVFFKHIGIYAYKISTLKKITKLPESILEKAESLEQNRWIENGYSIRAAITDLESVSIDTPEDLQRILEHPEYFS